VTATADLRTRQVRTAAIAAGAALAMAGLAYASVPLYRIFCQVTGFGGTTQRMEASAAPAAGEIRALGGKTIRVRFDGNVRSGLPWRFAPSQGPVEVKIGEQNLVYYRATSTHSAATTGSATFNVSPEAAGRYFAKVQCFCFNEQTLDAGQSAEMPVVFYVDPAILDDPDTRDISEITLSYSFFPVAAPGSSANGRPPGIYATGASSIAQNSR
jgi:cytochrome c oxidase assembly protein subunit 11